MLLCRPTAYLGPSETAQVKPAMYRGQMTHKPELTCDKLVRTRSGLGLLVGYDPGGRYGSVE